MANEYSLGTPGEYYPPKTIYIVFMFLVVAFMFWGMIGARDQAIKNAMIFYIGFGSILGILPVIFDNLTVKTFNRFDTVTIETPKIKIFNLKYVFVVSAILTIAIVSKIFVTQQAFVPYPEFNFFQSGVGNAIMSGIYGLAENWFFFVFMFPTFFAIFSMAIKNKVIGFLISSVLTAFLFMTFHILVYQARQDALFSTLIFAFICVSSTTLFRTIIPADIMHFFNNFVGRIISAGVGFSILGM